MRRMSLMLAAAGGVAVLAVAGAALGVAAADRSGGPTAPAAVTADGTGPAGEDNPARQGVDDDGGATPADDGGTTTAPAPAPTSGAAVDRQRAAEVALARIGGGRVVEVEAETEHGRPAWSVKITRDGWRHEVKVDRGDGTVLEVERQRAGADDRGGHRGDDD
ncbi:PepSY domain-containing protein [Micromonospora sp. NPDC005313]|uniref:PepSY domain-containing protein n=1 Tax=Micromonospora sp. NPDC005313 TaxID=3154296 RepID=UPI0033A4964A